MTDSPILLSTPTGSDTNKASTYVTVTPTTICIFIQPLLTSFPLAFAALLFMFGSPSSSNPSPLNVGTA